MLTAKNISICRGGKYLLKDVSCELKPGVFTVILGPNGAGKSTLLRVLSGEWLPDSGVASLDDQSVSDWNPTELAKRRAVLGQESHLRFAFSVRDVVLMGRLPHSPDGDTPADLEIANCALEQMDVAHLGERLFPTLSGGEKQRIHLARVLAQIAVQQAGPSRYLLLDEPTNNLDLAHQFALMRKIKSLTAAGVGVVGILHDLTLAAQFADRLLLLHQGCVAGFGSPCEVLTPAMINTVFSLHAKWVDANDGYGPLLRFKTESFMP